MSRLLVVVATLLFAAAAVADGPRADVLLIERTQAARATELPSRGMTMAQVRAKFGSPQGQYEPSGGQRPQWPVIHRWGYPEFTVYFENERVISAVLRKATPDELGPKPIR